MRAARASFMGTRARKILREDWAGTVRSGHATGTYIRRDTGETLLLHDEAFGVIPFGLGCPPGSPCDGPDWRAMEPGTSVRNAAQDALLHMGGAALLYGAAAVPESVLPAAFGPAPDSARLASGVAAALRLLTPAHGIAALYLENPEALFAKTSQPPPAADIWERAAWEPLRGLLAWCRARPAASAPENLVTSLVGLGPGLTPLADDILCGLLGAGHTLYRAFASPPLRRLTERIAPAVAKAAAETTTTQSAAFLASAAAGEHFGMLDALVAAMYSGDMEKIAAALEDTANVGHSSGGGLILGVLTASLLCTYAP